MNNHIPREFAVTLSKGDVDIILCTLWAASEMTTGAQAHKMLTAADNLKAQVGLSGFEPERPGSEMMRQAAQARPSKRLFKRGPK